MRLLANTKNLAGAAGAVVLITIGAATVFAQEESAGISGATATHIAVLSGESEVPPITTNGTGTAFFVYDPQVNSLSWAVEFQDLTGPATGAHIHGPAEAGENADVIIDLAPSGMESPLEGTTEISAEQATQLANGLWYVNVHTEGNPDGEIRGQIETNM